MHLFIFELYNVICVLHVNIAEFSICNVHFILFFVSNDERCCQVKKKKKTIHFNMLILLISCFYYFRSEIAKNLKHDSFAFIFGVNYFIALCLSSILTYIFVQDIFFTIPVNEQVIIKYFLMCCSIVSNK